MEFIQKKRGVKQTFTLRDDHFNYAYEDKSGSGDIDLNYVDFPQKSSVSIEQNEWLRNVGLLWIALGVAQIGWAIFNDLSLSGKGFWLMVGMACVLWAHFSKTRYSVFRTERGNVLVMQNKQHQQIVETLHARRKAQLLDWYGDVNPDNELENEIRKFQWLVEQDVMTQAESEQKIAQAQLLHNSQYESTETKLN
ncbi:MAG: hypothetical protein GY923_19480 [Aestuariibacter sp.]|uniref:hypothetical protein n=1 Tax=Marisediminitalea aggregata TaxID=634436 RepID=UPI0020CE585C|nr:hypothetical protein [Marisediminitalea aggregata]MCP3865487.1 hypothetical protein [Aestuariibacter sp.]MCP4233825.1 hypothetical protein [Aestuariibacter sp.]MCP4529495.1 hypothetical protein [Aestuariibacter sp.]MCP4949673.1 hypothetical protein [Aestuariibacter sp.]MCP5011097.1 hypothetical protein [Aestuariibacter sp.]